MTSRFITFSFPSSIVSMDGPSVHSASKMSSLLLRAAERSCGLQDTVLFRSQFHTSTVLILACLQCRGGLAPKIGFLLLLVCNLVSFLFWGLSTSISKSCGRPYLRTDCQGQMAAGELEQQMPLKIMEKRGHAFPFLTEGRSSLKLLTVLRSGCVSVSFP